MLLHQFSMLKWLIKKMVFHNSILPRNKVVDLYINSEVDLDLDHLEEYSLSSPENTIYRALKTFGFFRVKRSIGCNKSVFQRYRKK